MPFKFALIATTCLEKYPEGLKRSSLQPTYLPSHLLLLFCDANLQPPPPSDPRDTSAPFLAAIASMTSKDLLQHLADNGAPAAQELQQELEEARQFQAASRAALKDAAVCARTNEGRQTYQTILTAHTYDVDEGPSRLTNHRKAEILGVDSAELSRARKRAKSLQPALHPAAARAAGAYWYRDGRPRNDSTPPELVALMKDFWHNDAVSRLTGNSAHVFRESKSPTARTHPRRQLMVEGGARQCSPSS